MNCQGERLYINNDVPLKLEELYDPEDESQALITNATVTVNIVDDNGVAVGSEIELPFDTDKQYYYGVAEASLAFEEGERYTFIYTAVTPDGGEFEKRHDLVAEYRTN